MIETLERELANEIKAKNQTVKAYDSRIRNLRNAITNLKQADKTAEKMNAEEPKRLTKHY